MAALGNHSSGLRGSSSRHNQEAGAVRKMLCTDEEDKKWFELVEEVHKFELDPTAGDESIEHQLLVLRRLAPRAPEAWRLPHVQSSFCTAHLLCSHPAAFWRRLMKRFPESKQIIVSVSESLSEGALGDEGKVPNEESITSGNICLAIQEAGYHSGGIGRFVYHAARALADLISAGEIDVRGKRILELGCGKFESARSSSFPGPIIPPVLAHFIESPTHPLAQRIAPFKKRFPPPSELMRQLVGCHRCGLRWFGLRKSGSPLCNLYRLQPGVG